MIAVATGRPRIQEVNVEYTHRRTEIGEEPQRRGLRVASHVHSIALEPVRVIALALLALNSGHATRP